MKKLVLILLLLVSHFTFGQNLQVIVEDSTFSSGIGKLFRANRLDTIEGFYATYDDFLNERITDTVEFYLNNNPYFGENKLYVKIKKANGKTSNKLFKSINSTYWGARIRIVGGYKDFRFFNNKVLEILLTGDIWMYATGGLHVINELSSRGRNHDKMLLTMKDTPFNGSLQLAIEQSQDGHKEMAYFQKGLEGNLVMSRGLGKTTALKMFEDRKIIYDSFNSTNFKGQIDRVKQLYMHIDLYNHCTE